VKPIVVVRGAKTFTAAPGRRKSRLNAVVTRI
jgi:hypothetical protein